MPAKIVTRPSGRLVAVTGASQSGKSHWTALQVKAAPRLLVWDYKAEWFHKHNCRRVQSFAELAQIARSGARPERIAYCTTGMNREAFDFFCRFAWIWLRQAAGVLVIEETASVTSPGKAPDGWGDVCRMGLGFGCDIYAVTQRPAESDKTALGNASLVHCHRMGTDDDIRYMSKLLRVDAARVDSLLDYQWIERFSDGTLRAGGPGIAQKTVRPHKPKRTIAGVDRRAVAGVRQRP